MTDTTDNTQEIRRQCAMVDCAIMMDSTGSMGSWIQACKEKTNLIVDEIRQKYTNAIIRYAFVGYRDFGEKDDILDFTDDLDIFKRFVSGVTASGGGDTAEDVFGGLEKTLALSWENRTRVLVHFADAPGHGRFYSNVNDNHPHIDPDGAIGKKYMQTLVEKQIKYTFCKVTSETDQMIAKFREFYDGVSSDFKLSQIELGFESGSTRPSVGVRSSSISMDRGAPSMKSASFNLLRKKKSMEETKKYDFDERSLESEMSVPMSAPMRSSYVSAMVSTISDAIEESVKRSTK
jgi:hypothetical protein